MNGKELDDRGLAMWRAIEDAVHHWHDRNDVMGIGAAGGHVVIIRIHEVEPDIFDHQPRVRYDRIG